SLKELPTMPTPVLLQSVFKGAGAVTSSTQALTVSANSLLVAYLLASTATVAVLGVSDNVNGPWNPDNTPAGANSVTAGIFTFPGSAAGAITVSFTQTSGSAQLRILLEEWSNVLTVSPLDQIGAHPQGASTSFQTGTTPTTLQNGELILACIFENGSTTPSVFPSGFTPDNPTGQA